VLVITSQHSQERDFHVPAGFEPTVPTKERPQAHASDCTVTDIGSELKYVAKYIVK